MSDEVDVERGLREILMSLRSGDYITALFINRTNNKKLTLEGNVIVTFTGEVCLEFNDDLEFWLFTQLGGNHPDLKAIRKSGFIL